MREVEKCPECGSRNLGVGTLSGYACLSAGGFKSSPLTAVVCADCGLIIELRAKKPHVFKPKNKEV